jgi:cystathionine gamma-synthase
MSRTSIETLAVRAGIETDTQYGAITPPLYLSSNFSFADFDQKRQYDYSRSGNPTRDLLGDALSDLEGGFGGVITSSGMSAILSVIQLLNPEDTLIAPHDCYGGSFRLFKTYAEKGLFKLKFIDQTNDDVFAKALESKPKIVWIETPSNPLLRVVDINKLSALTKNIVGSKAIVVVDNTFLSPIFQKPLSLGADIVVHSTTKYINGHSDVVGGAVISKTEELHEDVKWWSNCIGATGAPFDSFLTLRGLRTLDVRVQRHANNADKIVNFLVSHTQVEHVYYPGLVGHQGHEIAKKQQSGFGSMLSFKLKGGVESVKLFLKCLTIFSLAESLGGVESLICHPATMTHAAVSPEEQKIAGITDNLLRLSVGIENVDDLLQDLQDAFEKIGALGKAIYSINEEESKIAVSC